MSVDLSKYAWDSRTIPFIRVKGGRKVLSEVRRSREITDMAHQFIAVGGRFLIAEVHDDNREVEIELIATTNNFSGIPVCFAREVSDNGPELPKAVDRLVRAAFAKIDQVN